MAPDGQPAGEPPLGNARRWAITVTVMLVSVLQVLDTSVTNVALPHIQGALSAGLDEVSWVLTSYLAANAIALPATGWLTARLGRRRFFLICTALFTVSSFLSAVAPSIEFLIAMRILQGLGGGPIIPVAQAVLWEIFPPHQRGMAMAVWGLGIVLAPLSSSFASGMVSQASQTRREQAYANARVALQRLRLDVHCATAVTSVEQNSYGGFTLTLTESNDQSPAGWCPAVIPAGATIASRDLCGVNGNGYCSSDF